MGIGNPATCGFHHSHPPSPVWVNLNEVRSNIVFCAVIHGCKTMAEFKLAHTTVSLVGWFMHNRIQIIYVALFPYKCICYTNKLLNYWGMKEPLLIILIMKPNLVRCCFVMQDKRYQCGNTFACTSTELHIFTLQSVAGIHTRK